LASTRSTAGLAGTPESPEALPSAHTILASSFFHCAAYVNLSKASIDSSLQLAPLAKQNLG
jgi:hypothetical protein